MTAPATSAGPGAPPTDPGTPGFPWYRSRVPAWPVIGIFLILLFRFITDAQNFLMPVTLATLLFFVFTPFRRLMDRWGVRSTVTAAIVTFGLLAAIAGIGFAISGPAQKLIDNSASIGQRLEQTVGELRARFRGLERAAAKIEQVTSGGSSGEAAAPMPEPATEPPTTLPRNPPPAIAPAVGAAGISSAASAAAGAGGSAAPIPDPDITAQATVRTEQPNDPQAPPVRQEISVKVDTQPTGSGFSSRLLTLGPEILSQAGFTLLLLFFLMDSGDLFYLRIVQSFGSMRQKRTAYAALRAIEDSLGAYLGSITLINALLGVATGIAMWAWGLPSPLLFGLGMFVLNFIPYIGSITMTTAAAITALLVYGDLFHPLMAGATVVALTTVEGNFITPYFVSRRLQLNPVVVFLTVALWAWLWSILGMVVAVPVLVVLRVLCDHIPGLEKLGNFLAGEEAPGLGEDDEDDDAEESGARPAPDPARA